MKTQWIATLMALVLCASLNAQQAKKIPVTYRKIQKYLDKATAEKLAGVSIYINHLEYGKWVGTSGYADLDKEIPLNQEHIFAMASVGKMYNAVAALKLAELGKISLDDRIKDYLPASISENLPNVDVVTIRHLLGHTSGYINYDRDPELNELYTAGKLKLDTLSHEEALERYVYGTNLRNHPGAEYHYSSTNYMLLAMVLDSAISDHAQFLRNGILKEYGFENTYYKQIPPDQTIRYYGDLNQDGVSEDLTSQTFETTNWFIGDDGVYASIEEAARFLEDLMQGRILSKEYLTQMKTWNDDKSPDYGYGLMADKGFPYKFLMGHSGRGIGTTADVYYFPKQDISIAIFCNSGLRAASPEFAKVYNNMRKKIIKKLFLF